MQTHFDFNDAPESAVRSKGWASSTISPKENVFTLEEKPLAVTDDMPIRKRQRRNGDDFEQEAKNSML